jgi:hypothetical protein
MAANLVSRFRLNFARATRIGTRSVDFRLWFRTAGDALRENLRLLLVFCNGPIWYTQQLYFQRTLPSHISRGTDTIMIRYGTGRTEIPFGPFDVCFWVSPFLVQDSPIEGTPHQSPFRGMFAEPPN